MLRCVLLLGVVAHAAQGGNYCVPPSQPSPPAPSFPVEDAGIASPRGRSQRVLTRAQNSEVVDLGHPGDPVSPVEQSNCPHDEEGVERWEDVVPAPEAYGPVDLPHGKKVLLSACSVTVPLGRIKIPWNTELIFADEPIDLSVFGMHVFGKVRAGSETCRLRSKATITLRGARPAAGNAVVPSPVAKGIYVVNGTLDIHAAEYYHTWSRLAATAKPGDTMILLQDSVNWDLGSAIVVTATQFKDARDWHQNEERRVVSVKAASHLGEGITAIYLDRALDFAHYGGDEYQAEVGLLSRRFVIQGDARDSEPTDTTPIGCSSDKYASFPCPDTYLTGYGGHVMMQGIKAKARISGVEFYRMGQTNFEGRYPIHFHLVYDGGQGSYVRDSSFHRSFYKCVTLHGANHVLVSRNVAYDVIGHCLYLEDGVEEYNRIEYNLHAHVHPIGMPPGDGANAQFLDDIHSSPSLTTASDATASGFYLPNALNYVKGNAAVGGFSGFQFPIFEEPIGLHRSWDMTPRSRQSLEFDGNSCRSAGLWWGHAGCVYLGGLFYHTDSSYDSNAPMIYNPGREINGLRPCEVDASGFCPQEEDPRCGGAYPTACEAFIVITNFKAALCSTGVMNWGSRARLIKFEAHDLNGGPAAELFGDNSITDALVTCETDNVHHVAKWCDRDTPHRGAHFGEELTCSYWDNRLWRNRRKVVQWYDTLMNTAITNTTIRNCDPAQWRIEPCEWGCPTSSIFESFTHSNQYLPEFLSLTADLRFDDSHDSLRDYVVSYNSPDTYSVSGRTAAWLDVDGTLCQPSLGRGNQQGEPYILGSDHDAGEWWLLGDDCESVGVRSLMLCCKARHRLLASLYFSWDDDLEKQLKGSGGNLCENDSKPWHSDCPQVGYAARFGQTSLADQGLKVMMRPEVVGPVPTADADEGFGWYFWVEHGAPVELTLRQLQIHHDAIFILAVAYPKGTTFDVTMHAEERCAKRWDGSSWLCSFEYSQTWDKSSLYSDKAEPKYYVDASHAAYDLLYVRVYQRESRRLSETPQWDTEWTAPLFTDKTIDALDGNYFGIPLRSKSPYVTIKASCEASGAYCAGGPIDADIPPLLWKPTSSPTATPTMTSSPTAVPTPQPTPLPTLLPTAKPTENPTPEPTRSPTPRPTLAPTFKPTTSPTETPTPRPTSSPTANPTRSPTPRPTLTPTPEPTAKPTKTPTPGPTSSPTTLKPTMKPTPYPTTPDIAVVAFVLVDGGTGQDYMTLKDGVVYFNETTFDPALCNIRADVESEANVGSVVMELSGNGGTIALSTENAVPYTVFGGELGNYTLAHGLLDTETPYSLAATPYTLPDGRGDAGSPLTINFLLRTN